MDSVVEVVQTVVSVGRDDVLSSCEGSLWHALCPGEDPYGFSLEEKIVGARVNDRISTIVCRENTIVSTVAEEELDAELSTFFLLGLCIHWVDFSCFWVHLSIVHWNFSVGLKLVVGLHAVSIFEGQFFVSCNFVPSTHVLRYIETRLECWWRATPPAFSGERVDSERKQERYDTDNMHLIYF